MSEREPIVEESRMPGKAIAVEERRASDAATRKADGAEAAAREPGMRKAAADSAKAMSTKAVSTKAVSTKSTKAMAAETMATKTVPAAKPSMAATAAVSSSPSRRHIGRGTGNESRRGGQHD